MYTTDLEVLVTASRWVAAGHFVVLATVVKTWGSSPRPLGSMMVIRDDGHVRGSVSGGCIEDDLIDRMRSHDLTRLLPFPTAYGMDADEAHRFGLPCGGTLALMLEPLGAASRLDELIDALRQGRVLQRTVEIATGTVTLEDTTRSESAHVTDTHYISFHGPQYRLVIIGAGQLSRYVAQFAIALDYAVTVCDPREEFLSEWDVAGVQCSDEMPDDLIVHMAPDARTAVVTLTHDPKLDDMALLEALSSQAFYVGALGSRKNTAQRRDRLALFDLGQSSIDRLRGPVGLHLGAKTPPEIALAIVAELTAFRHGIPVVQTHPSAHESGVTVSELPKGFGVVKPVSTTSKAT